jgi:hypothetical protein
VSVRLPAFNKSVHATYIYDPNEVKKNDCSNPESQIVLSGNKVVVVVVGLLVVVVVVGINAFST